MDIRFTINGVLYSITADERQFFLNEVRVYDTGKNKGKEYLENKGSFPNEILALKKAYNLQRRAFPAKTFEELAKVSRDMIKVLEEIAAQMGVVVW